MKNKFRVSPARRTSYNLWACTLTGIIVFMLVQPLCRERLEIVSALRAGAEQSSSVVEEAGSLKDPSVDPVKNHIFIYGSRAERLYGPIIEKAAERHNVDPALMKAIVMAESSYNPRAISRRGAKGLMQLMPGTAEALGVEDSFNPEHNINGGVKYFRVLLNKFKGDVELALAAYNAGITKVRQYNGVPPFKATRIYIKKVFKYRERYDRMYGTKVENA